jgi:hypothetical protein
MMKTAGKKYRVPELVDQAKFQFVKMYDSTCVCRKSATSAGGNANDPTSQLAAALDKRPLPPICKIQRALGRHLTYQLKYVVQSLSHASLEQEALQIAECTGVKSGN